MGKPLLYLRILSNQNPVSTMPQGNSELVRLPRPVDECIKAASKSNDKENPYDTQGLQGRKVKFYANIEVFAFCGQMIKVDFEDWGLGTHGQLKIFRRRRADSTT